MVDILNVFEFVIRLFIEEEQLFGELFGELFGGNNNAVGVGIFTNKSVVIFPVTSLAV